MVEWGGNTKSTNKMRSSTHRNATRHASSPTTRHWRSPGVFLLIPLTPERGPPVCGCCWTCHSCTSAGWHLLDSSSNLWLLWHHWKTSKRWKLAVIVYETSAKPPGVRFEYQSPVCTPPTWEQKEPQDFFSRVLPLTKHQLLNLDDDEWMLSVQSLCLQWTNLWMPRGRKGGRRKV